MKPPMTHVHGDPLTPEIMELFSPWGTARGLAVSPTLGIVVQFAEGFQLTFTAWSNREPVGLDPLNFLFKP